VYSFITPIFNSGTESVERLEPYQSPVSGQIVVPPTIVAAGSGSGMLALFQDKALEEQVRRSSYYLFHAWT